MAKRNYKNDYASVTTVLGVLRKIALEWWFKNNTLAEIEAKSARGKEIGKQMHEVIQSYIETGVAKIDTQYPEEITNALKSFMLFRKEHPEIVLHKSETELTSEVHKFNGTLDVTGEENGVVLVGDWKSGECKDKELPSIYDEFKYQVSAYHELHNEVNERKAAGAFIVALAKDKVAYNFLRLSEDEIKGNFNEVFLSALKIYNHQRRK